ncbi:group II intron reverse transcriptase/maturase [Agrobacterium vitis]|uniref:Group II intron reverse transcriptase/maturase n=1 Tax=Agrobacterium vitis TaxID=373 RepID=A0AAE4WEP8_AGRVI|nr:group II intron reverse transcriptase/maturase [Agrobacterium vitis]MCF1499285.1 group II intron reverse transcriptase/maturase [Allorhizobium sp. Av2]MCM2439467.1 group II intron reverse transcriptase/maturase [Agrobacterium vitis]MUZ57632.1 group II intron reverse transcriptase/maturase [Agrobacterium vitis]
MSGEVNTSFVLDMQRKLYRWSSENPDKVFADLFNLICDRRTLNEAWQRLARNSGSRTPGTDGMTRRTVEQRPGGAATLLDEIREALRNGTYQPQPVRQRLIPKPGKPGKFRPLGIPTLIDRLVQMAMKLVLEPIFEADFYPTSYGFRKGRSTHDALARIQRFLHPTKRGPSVYRYAIEGDIKGCFDAIDHHVMMERVRRRISDRKVLGLILAFLKAGVMIEGTVRHPVTGSPQGGIISPMLSNIYLTAIDERYGRWSMHPREPSRNAAARRVKDHKKGRSVFYIVRYADDFVVLVDGMREQAEAEKLSLAEFLKTELRMELSMEKTRITDVREGFDFLGYRVVQTKALRTGRPVGNLFIPKSKLNDLRHKIKVLVKDIPTGWPLAELIDKLNPILLGWRNYYRYATRAQRDFTHLDHWIWQRVWRWIRKKHRKGSWPALRHRYFHSAPGRPRQWTEGSKRLRLLYEGGTMRYPHQSIEKANGWNAQTKFRQRESMLGFLDALDRLRHV